MRFFVLAVVTLAATPIALSQPIEVERTQGSDLTAIVAPHEARELQPAFYDVIERSTIGDDSSELEARFFLFDMFKLADKGVKWLTKHIPSTKSSKSQQTSSQSSQTKTAAKD
ncbi:hypothetical protein H0H92_003165 [Tricholoma furcatifolium]|nr:hypothetical protein H0H92_003165 [Tricholoma furcatifolium]